MRSGPERIRSARPSTHDVRQTPATAESRPAYPFGDRNFLACSRRRARSAPDWISAKSSRKRRSGICQELGNKSETLTIKDFITFERSCPCTHFHHPDFEVVARNIPAHRAQELKHILETFSASLKSRKASYSDPDLLGHDRYDMMLNEGRKHASTTLHDPRTTNRTSLLGDTLTPPGSSLPQANHLSCKGTARSTTRARLDGEAFHEVLPQFAASTDPSLSLADTHCNTICYRPSSQKDINENHSDSSVDFLYLARKRDPESVRELEEEYDDMMRQVE